MMTWWKITPNSNTPKDHLSRKLSSLDYEGKGVPDDERTDVCAWAHRPVAASQWLRALSFLSSECP